MATYEIYGTSNCNFCEMAKNLLGEYNLDYAFIDVAEDEDITAAFFKKFPNVNKVPQIMDDDKYVGGYQELREWLSHTA